MHPNLHVIDNFDALVIVAARHIGAAIKSTIAKKGNCRISLAGGTTPSPIYRALSRNEILEPSLWNNIEILFGDERCVIPSSRDSNYKMVCENLLDLLPVDSTPVVHRIHGENPDKEQASLEYEKILIDGVDILILGMGQDGHTASLFPGSRAIEKSSRLNAVVESPKPPPWRITITPAFFKLASQIFLIAAGTDKADALARALQGTMDPKSSPVQLAIKGTWIVDRSAASKLVLNKKVNS